jgi:hypothetical protein
MSPSLGCRTAATGYSGDLDLEALLVALDPKPVPDPHCPGRLHPIVVDLHVPALHRGLGKTPRAEEPRTPEPLVDPQRSRAAGPSAIAFLLLAHVAIIGPL